MPDSLPESPPPQPGAQVALSPPAPTDTPATLLPSPEGGAALAAAETFARQAAAPATLRAYKADWQHYAAWCARSGFIPVPAAPATVGAYLASLATTHAPATIRRRVSAIGTSARGRRVRALLLIGFAGALRRMNSSGCRSRTSVWQRANASPVSWQAPTWCGTINEE
jgi:hypothetical protein